MVGLVHTGSYGAGLARFLRTHEVRLVEVDRPDHKMRRWQGKFDPVDAPSAAHAALAARSTGTLKAVTAGSEACVTCEWHAAAPRVTAPTCNARYRLSSSPRPSAAQRPS